MAPLRLLELLVQDPAQAPSEAEEERRIIYGGRSLKRTIEVLKTMVDLVTPATLNDLHEAFVADGLDCDLGFLGGPTNGIVGEQEGETCPFDHPLPLAAGVASNAHRRRLGRVEP